MSETQIKIGAGNTWAGERRPTAPLKTSDSQQSPVPKPVAAQEALQDAKPRSFQEIMAERNATGTVTPETQPKKTIWISVALFGTIALVLIGVAIVLMSMPSSTPRMQPTASSATGVPSSTPKAEDSNIPLSERYPASVQSFVDDEVIASKNGARLVRRGDGYTVEIDTTGTCIPNFWSPPPSWPERDGEAKFNSESARCSDDKNLSVVGYWRDTNWIFWAHPKKDSADPKKKDDWDFLWTDVSWHRITIEEIRKLPGVKDMYQAPPAAPQVPVVPQVQAPQQVYVPVPTPSCTTGADIRFSSKMTVSDAKGIPIGEVVGTSCYSQAEADANAQAKADVMKSGK